MATTVSPRADIDADTLGPIVLVGALHVDELHWLRAPLVMHASNPVHRERRVGGVAANAARAAHASCAALASRAGSSSPEPPPARRVVLGAALADDADGRWLLDTLLAAGVDCRTERVPGRASGRYTVVHDAAGELLIGLSDVDIAESLDAASVQRRLADERPAIVAVDANLSPACLAGLLARDGAHHPWPDTPRAALAVSPSKALRLAPHLATLELLLCNRREAAALGRIAVDSSLDALADALLAAGATRFVLSDGGAPVLVHEPGGRRSVAIPPVAIAGSVNGAGDALAGASLAHWLARGDLVAAVAEAGIPAARAVLSADASSRSPYPRPCR